MQRPKVCQITGRGETPVHQVDKSRYFPVVHVSFLGCAPSTLLAVHRQDIGSARPSHQLCTARKQHLHSCDFAHRFSWNFSLLASRFSYPSVPTRGLWTVSAQTTVRTEMHRSTFFELSYTPIFYTLQQGFHGLDGFGSETSIFIHLSVNYIFDRWIPSLTWIDV